MLDNKRYLEFLYQTGLERLAIGGFQCGGTADKYYQTVRVSSTKRRYVALHHLPGKGTSMG